MIKTVLGKLVLILTAAAAVLLLTSSAEQKRSSFTIHLIGDSTMAPRTSAEATLSAAGA